MTKKCYEFIRKRLLNKGMKLIGSNKRFNNWKRNKFKTNSIINNK